MAAVVLGLKPLLIATVFSSFLLPTGVVLFFFSTPALRRRPSFILNVCAVALGLTQGALTAYVTVSYNFFCTSRVDASNSASTAVPHRHDSLDVRRWQSPCVHLRGVQS